MPCKHTGDYFEVSRIITTIANKSKLPFMGLISTMGTDLNAEVRIPSKFDTCSEDTQSPSSVRMETVVITITILPTSITSPSPQHPYTE
jgi:hypothetical protein